MAPELNILISNSHINLTLDMYFNFSKMGWACLSAITVEVICFLKKDTVKKKRFKELYWIFSFNMENPKTSFKQGRRKKKKKKEKEEG